MFDFSPASFEHIKHIEPAVKNLRHLVRKDETRHQDEPSREAVFLVPLAEEKIRVHLVLLAHLCVFDLNHLALIVYDLADFGRPSGMERP